MEASDKTSVVDSCTIHNTPISKLPRGYYFYYSLLRDGHMAFNWWEVMTRNDHGNNYANYANVNAAAAAGDDDDLDFVIWLTKM